MMVECIVIIALVLVMSMMIFRTGKPGQAVAVLPLITVPLFHLIGMPLSSMLSQFFRAPSVGLFHISFEVIGLVISCVLYGMLAGNMGSRRGRRTYIILCGTFSALLVIVLVNGILPK